VAEAARCETGLTGFLELVTFVNVSSLYHGLSVSQCVVCIMDYQCHSVWSVSRIISVTVCGLCSLRT